MDNEYLKLFPHFSCTYAKKILPLQQLLKPIKFKTFLIIKFNDYGLRDF